MAANERANAEMLWKYDGYELPAFAERPRADQESVWEYPRPPVIDDEPRHVEVRFGDALIAESTRAVRVLETASAPGIYVPATDVRTELLRLANGSSHCEWKGQAAYFDLLTPEGAVPKVAWCYPSPTPAFAPIAGYLSFYPQRTQCYLGQERARPQPGGFYGGWVTSDLVGPIKGAPGTEGW